MPVKDSAAFMELGRGVNGINGKVRDLAVTVPPPATLFAEQPATFTCTKLSSIEELHAALGLGMDGSGSFGLLDGSEKLSLAMRFNSYSVFLLVNITCVTSAQRLQDEQLVPAAEDLLRAGQLDLFRQRFGDVYVKGIETGGQYCALIEIESTGKADQLNLSNTLEGNFPQATAGSGGRGPPIDNDPFFILSCIGSRHVTIAPPFQRGGLPGPREPSVLDVLTKAEGLPGEMQDGAIPLLVELQDYASLGVPTPPDGIDLQRVRAVLQQYVENRATLINILNDIAYIRQHPDQFGGDFDPPFFNSILDALESQARTELDARTRAASDCLHDFRHCAFQDPHLPSREALPARN